MGRHGGAKQRAKSPARGGEGGAILLAARRRRCRRRPPTLPLPQSSAPAPAPRAAPLPSPAQSCDPRRPRTAGTAGGAHHTHLDSGPSELSVPPTCCATLADASGAPCPPARPASQPASQPACPPCLPSLPGPHTPRSPAPGRVRAEGTRHSWWQPPRAALAGTRGGGRCRGCRCAAAQQGRGGGGVQWREQYSKAALQ